MNKEIIEKILKENRLPSDILLIDGKYECKISPKSAYEDLDNNHKLAIEKALSIKDKQIQECEKKLKEKVNIAINNNADYLLECDEEEEKEIGDRIITLKWILEEQDKVFSEYFGDFDSPRKKDKNDAQNVSYLETRSKNRGRQFKNGCMSVDADTPEDTNNKGDEK